MSDGPVPVRRGTAHLLPHQLEMVGDRTSKIRVMQGGYRSGKTVAGLACVVDMGLRSEGAPILVVEPTYRLILDVFIRCATDYLSKWKLPHRYHKSDKILSIGRRRQFDVLCRSADQPRSLEGLTVGGLLVDEWELCDIEALQVAMARVSVGPVQKIVLTGTPEGYGPGWELLLSKPEEYERRGTRVWVVQTAQNTTLRNDYVADMASRMDDEVAGEKLQGQRRAKGGRVYSRFDRTRHTRDPCVPLGQGELQVWADFNIGMMVWVVAVVDTAKRAAHIVGEFVGKGTDTAKQAEAIKPYLADYLKRTTRRHVSIQDITEMKIPVYCDASGTQRSSTGAALTNVVILQQAGFRAKHGPKNPPVTDRINTVQVMLRDRRLTIDPAAAPTTLMSIERQSYVKDQPDKAGGLDHACFPAGTMVESASGARRIEDVVVGDEVWTRAGLRRVVAAGRTGVREVMRLETTAGVLVATPDHPVFVDGAGFVRLDRIGYGNTLVGWAKPSSPSSFMVSHSDGIPRAPGEPTGSISPPVDPTVSEESDDSTKRFGARHTEPSPMAATYTMPTETRSTTISQTCSASPSPSTDGSTPAPTHSAPSLESRPRRPGPSPRHGTAAPAAAPGTPSTPPAPSPPATLDASAASTAAETQSASPSRATPLASAAGPARQPQGERPASTTSSASAPTAAPPFAAAASTRPLAALGPARVVDGGPVPVFNLTVEGVHEFFADGVLVHNCDAIGYGCHWQFPVWREGDRTRDR